MKIIFHPKSLEYKGTLGNKQRLVIAHDYLKDKFDFVEPELKIDEPVVHSKELIESVKKRDFMNFDSPAYENVFEYAMISVNCAVKAQEVEGFALCDPPGHHAGKNFLGGFCYFNNLAEAVQQSGLKTLIIDIDGHHGNGTEDIFLNDENVFFISLHRSPLYPGTGLESKGNILNIPLPGDCGEEIYLKSLKGALDEVVNKFKFEQIAVSAGFDTFDGDLASLGLRKKSFEKIGLMIKDLAIRNNAKLFCVLEGGYSEDLGELIEEFVSSFD